MPGIGAPFQVELGGWDTLSPASRVYPGSPDAQNVRWERSGILAKVAGYDDYNTTAMPTSNQNVLGLFQFNRRDTSTRYTIACTATRIMRVPTSGAWTNLTPSGAEPTGGSTDYFDAAVFNNELVIVNGVDAPWISDGTAAGTTRLVQTASLQARTALNTAMSTFFGIHQIEPGRLCALAGATAAGSFDAPTQCYDTIGDAWRTMSRANVGRDDGAGFTAFGNAYIVSGLSAATTFTATLEGYNPVTDTWRGYTDITSSRRQVPANSVNNSGYVQTGNDSASAASWTATNFQYDPAPDAWLTKTAHTGTARRQACGFRISQTAHVVSGRISTGPDNDDSDHREYNPFSDTWTSLTAITASRRQAGGGVGYDNLGYTAGGADSAGTLVTAIRSYNRVTDAWTASSAVLTTAKQAPGMASDEYWLYFGGGAAASGTANGEMERLNTAPAPPSARYIESFKSYVLMARTTAFPSRVFYSVVGDARIWHPFAFFDVMPDDGDWITGLFSYDGRFYVSKTDTMYQIAFSTLHPVNGDQQIIPLDNVKGAVSNRSIVVTDHGVYYLAEDGFRMFDGARSRVISEKIQPTLDGYVDSRNDDCSGVWVRGRDEIMWSLTSTGSVHDRVVVYNYRFQRWSFLTINAETWASVEDANDIEQILFGTTTSSQTADVGRIMTFDTGNSFNGSTIAAVYQTGWFSPNTGLERTLPRFLYLWTNRPAATTLTLQSRINYGTANATSDSIGMDAANTYYEDTTDLRAKVELGFDTTGHAISLRFSDTSSNAAWQIHGAVMTAVESVGGGVFPT